jgi:hypothetical protein
MKARDVIAAPFWLLAHIMGLISVAIGGTAIVLAAMAALIDGNP